MGWELWESYFKRNYGDDWRQRRNGRRGLCGYCAGRITTETSRRETAQSKQYDDPSCLTGKERATKKEKKRGK